MNDNTDYKIKALQNLNSSIQEFNIILRDLIQSRKKDKLEWFRVVNTDLKEVNTILTDIFTSREKDAITNELHQMKQ